MIGWPASYRIGILVLVALGTCCSTLFAACVWDANADPHFNTVLVQLGTTEVMCEVADTVAIREIGLSGRDSLPAGHGMLFDMKTERDATFWMKGMRFPIDIVWIDPDFAVVRIDHDVPIVGPDISDSAIPLYDSGGIPVRYVLEMNAGMAAEHGIVVGAEVMIQEGTRSDGRSR